MTNREHDGYDRDELTEHERELFQENGFMGPFKVYEPDEAHRLLRAIRPRLQTAEESIYPSQNLNYDRHFDIPELARHISNPRLVGKLKGLLGPDLLCWRTEIFPKFPGDTGTEWHQVEEFSYASGVPALVPTLPRTTAPVEMTVWTAFTEATLENGCMKFMPGSHKVWYFDERKGLHEAADYRDGKKTEFFGYHYAELKVDPTWEPDESKAVRLEMRPGEAVIFTARCMHGSLPNTSQRKVRIAYTSRYVPTHVRVYPDPHDPTKQQEVLREHHNELDLRRHGCVLVSGSDQYGHNRIRTTDEAGRPFEQELEI